MKTSKYKRLMPAVAIVASFFLATNVNAQQKKLPDGTIVYSDGTRRLPNGTVVYKGGNVGERNSTVKLPDGSVVLPDGSRTYPNSKGYPNSRNNGKHLPPGQAKKIYGGSARDYAPGQQKNKVKDREWREDKYEGKKQGKGNKHKD